MLEPFTALATWFGSFRHSPVGPGCVTVRMKPSCGSDHSIILVEQSEGFTALTLIVDTDPIILVSNGGDTGSGIQDDLERVQISIV
jgi:hypothetical protein